MTYERAREAYSNDPMFRALVDTMRHLIGKLEMTPNEVRNAAVFACILHEERIPRRYRVAGTNMILEQRMVAEGPPDRPETIEIGPFLYRRIECDVQGCGNAVRYELIGAGSDDHGMYCHAKPCRSGEWH